jgi:hypothetical protein
MKTDGDVAWNNLANWAKVRRVRVERLHCNRGASLISHVVLARKAMSSIQASVMIQHKTGERPNLEDSFDALKSIRLEWLN